jgi:hypothetical protein
MALKAIHPVISDVGIMNEHGVFESLYPLDMAGMAAFPGNVACAGGDVKMTLVAGHAYFHI